MIILQSRRFLFYPWPTFWSPCCDDGPIRPNSFEQHLCFGRFSLHNVDPSSSTYGQPFHVAPSIDTYNAAILTFQFNIANTKLTEVNLYQHPLAEPKQLLLATSTSTLGQRVGNLHNSQTMDLYKSSFSPHLGQIRGFTMLGTSIGRPLLVVLYMFAMRLSFLLILGNLFPRHAIDNMGITHQGSLQYNALQAAWPSLFMGNISTNVFSIILTIDDPYLLEYILPTSPQLNLLQCPILTL